MSLSREFRNTGNWLFSKRSYVPVILYPAATLVLLLDKQSIIDKLDISWSIACLSVSMLGLLIRILVIGFTPKGTSGRNTKGQVADSLNTKGIYSLVRHPFYLGNYFMWLGLLLYVGNFWFVGVATLLFWIYYERIMYAEESFLIEKFGEAYKEWSSQTPAFFPRLSGWKKTPLQFSFKNVLKREYNGFFATILSFTYLDVLHNYTENQSIVPDKFWIISLIVAFVIFITLRSLKHYTKVLHVDGR